MSTARTSLFPWQPANAKAEADDSGEEKYKEAEEACYSCFSRTNRGNRIGEPRGWSGIYEATKSYAHLQRAIMESVLREVTVFSLRTAIQWLIQIMTEFLRKLH